MQLLAPEDDGSLCMLRQYHHRWRAREVVEESLDVVPGDVTAATGSSNDRRTCEPLEQAVKRRFIIPG